MKKFILLVAAVFGMTIAANAAEYSVNDADIDALIENAVEVSPASVLADAVAVANTTSSASFVSAKSDVAAILFCFFLGGLGIHRHYMGTATFMWAAYFFTFGGIFGIVPLVDFIVMLVKCADGSGCGEFYGSKKFFMWA